jgi:hypothetical protein
MGDDRRLLSGNSDVVKVQLDSVAARSDVEYDTSELDTVQEADGRWLRRCYGKKKT